MEVGAVKQAFNNEVILLKNKLNQAKIQIIHKLTRKAKTLTEKKAQDPLKEKLKRKAESAVNEVLIIKKIKAKDLAKFIVTHDKQLNVYLNRPVVDHEKACARLLLHKSLQEKYTVIRERFADMQIEDLFMSREERRKLKKEAKEKQKNKKKNKDKSKAVKAGGDWDVEDVEMKDSNRSLIDDISCDDEGSEVDSGVSNPDNESNSDFGNCEDKSDDEVQMQYDHASENESDTDEKNNRDKGSDANEENDEEDVSDGDKESNGDHENDSNEENDGNKESDQDEEIKTKPGSIKKLSLVKKETSNPLHKTPVCNKKEIKTITNKNKKKQSKPKNVNKNKKLNEKILLRKFKKDSGDAPKEGNKMVDPFFITSTGENYISLAEPRQPDEIKEIHKEGNRKYRRAVMFGRVEKPRRNQNYRNDENRLNKQNSFQRNRPDFKDVSNKWRDNNNSRKTSFGNKNDPNFTKNALAESKPEKLHPSWEAKKRQSSILPFQGKKIVFDDS